MLLTLIGHPAIQPAPPAPSLPLAAERRFQLLAYLAVTGGWVPRPRLAALFWPDHGEGDARRNLRRLLHDVKRLPWMTGLEIAGDALRWTVDTDLARFREAAARGDDATAAAMDGVLLEGLEHDATAAFADWLDVERAHQRARWQDAVARRRAALAGDPVAQLAFERQVLRADPFCEAAMAGLIGAARAAGRPAEAAEAWRDYRRQLEDELGVAPSAALSALAARLGEPLDAGDAAIAPPRRAMDGDALIGRAAERAALTTLLRDARARIAWLHGPSGAGKSALARAVLPALAADFPGGIHWAAMDEADHAGVIRARIAEACGLPAAMPVSRMGMALARHIGGRRMLIVIDGITCARETFDFARLVTAACPGLTILFTSRQPMPACDPWQMALAGLPVPAAGETDVTALRRYDAVRLFEDAARAADPGFALERHARECVQLIRALDGLPLGIRLAATCARLLGRPGLARELRGLVGLALPQSPANDARWREPALRALA